MVVNEASFWFTLHLWLFQAWKVHGDSAIKSKAQLKM